MIDFHEKYPAASDLMAFIDQSPSPYHCVATVVERLKEHGFVELKESDSWPSPLPECFYVTRNDSSIAVFQVPEGAELGEGFLLAGAHTDSPCLKLKDKGEFDSRGYAQVGIEKYGGVLNATWVDRDLAVSGRFVVDAGDKRQTVLVSSKQPLIRIPNLAIHLNREANTKLSYNVQTELTPIVALADSDGKTLIEALAEMHDIDPAKVLSSELYTHITEKSDFWGTSGEFIAAPRLDNQASCCAILTGFLESLESDPGKIKGFALFDNEEIGSRTLQGANSNFLPSMLERIAESFQTERSHYLKALSQSFFISADLAHAIHPNYASMHDQNHYPELNQGPVIKSNANYRYTTDSRAAVAFADMCEAVNVPCQNFINRSDLGCGSTVGPMVAAELGIRSIDVGTSELAMHSARETAGSKDPEYINAVFAQYYGHGIELID